MNNDLMAKLKKNSTIDEAATLDKSIFFSKKDCAPIMVPMMNVAFSGRLDGGLTPGLTQFAGESKHFKTLFCLVSAKAYMDKYPESLMIFYDSEFGSPMKYFDSLGIDRKRVLHSPLTDIGKMSTDVVNQVEGLNRGDKVIFVIDSVGNLASKKEIKDTMEANDKVDMTRPKALKSFARIITSLLTLKDVPLLIVNHTYDTQEMYSTKVVSGGQGLYLASDNIFIIGRQQEKDKDNKVVGYHFIMNIEKSRHSKEKTKIPITVTFENGILKWSGLLENAVEAGIVTKEKVGNKNTYRRAGTEENLSAEQTNTAAYWEPILADKTFQTFIEKKYALDDSPLITEG